MHSLSYTSTNTNSHSLTNLYPSLPPSLSLQPPSDPSSYPSTGPTPPSGQEDHQSTYHYHAFALALAAGKGGSSTTSSSSSSSSSTSSGTSSGNDTTAAAIVTPESSAASSDPTSVPLSPTTHAPTPATDTNDNNRTPAAVSGPSNGSVPSTIPVPSPASVPSIPASPPAAVLVATLCADLLRAGRYHCLGAIVGTTSYIQRTAYTIKHYIYYQINSSVTYRYLPHTLFLTPPPPPLNYPGVLLGSTNADSGSGSAGWEMLRAYALGRCIRGERMSEMSTTFFEAQGTKDKGLDKGQSQGQSQDNDENKSSMPLLPSEAIQETTTTQSTAAADATLITAPSSSSPVTVTSLEETLMDIAKAFRLHKLILPPPRTDWLGESTSFAF